MKWLLSVFAACIVATGALAAPPQGARQLMPSDMQRAPQTAVIMTQCNLLVAGYFTLADGTLVKLDQSSRAVFKDVNAVLAWGGTARGGAERVDAQCAHKGADLET